MSEYYACDAKYTCRACKENSEDLFTMSNDEILLYEKFIKLDTVHTNTIMKICFICRCILSKFKKFVLQCQRSNEVMNGLLKDQLCIKPHNYTCTITTHYVGPETEDSDANGDQYDHDGISDDDIPLLMLKDNVKQVDVKVKKRRKKDVVTELVPIENAQEETKGKKNKQKKQLKEGFSSRMVQETNEYEVIKLSKEQVIEEMVEKSKSDKYLRSVYKCEKCVKGFNFKDVIDNHMKKHLQEHGTLKCEICAQYCPSTVSLRGHMKSHTTRYKCKICGAVRISRQHLLEHYSIEHTFDASTYTCDHCPFTTKKRTVIQRHVKSHKSGKSLTCTVCGAGFNNMHALRMHVSKRTVIQRHVKSHKSGKSLTCTVCGAGFNNMHALRMHVSRHDPTQRFSCPQCNMKFIYPSLLHRHMRSHSHRDHYCVECDVTFKSLDNLKLHFKRAKKHRDPSTYKYKCSQCDERFISPSSVLAHLTASHGAAKSHACSLCGKLYSSRESVRSHERRAHARAEGEGVNRKSTMKRLRTHDDHTFCFPADGEKHKKQEESINVIQAVTHET